MRERVTTCQGKRLQLCWNTGRQAQVVFQELRVKA